MNLKMSRDKNGNKTVIVTFPGSRSFSIQTSGVLTETHATNIPQPLEIKAYIRQYGTLRQKSLLETYDGI